VIGRCDVHCCTPANMNIIGKVTGKKESLLRIELLSKKEEEDMSRMVDRVMGVRCKGCGKRKPLSQFVGCAKCGEAYCSVCTAGGPNSRICSPCEDKIHNPTISITHGEAEGGRRQEAN